MSIVAEAPATPARIVVKTAAQIAGVSPGQVYAWCQSGKLKHYRYPGSHRRAVVRIDRADLERLISESTCEPSDD